MTAISKVFVPEPGRRYRDLAREARVQAVRSKRVPRHEAAYLRMASRWEELAFEAEEAEHVCAFLKKAW